MAISVSSSASSRFEWKVKNIFSEGGQESEKFGFHASLWRLFLWKVFLREGTDVIRVRLTTNDAGKPSADFMSRVFIVDKNQTPQFLAEKVCPHEGGYHNECVWKADIEDLRERENVLSVDGVVSFVCILMLKTTPEEENKVKSSVQTSITAKAREAHLLDFHRLLDDSALSDVTLKCGDRTISAHRLILSARSEVFAAMLRSDMAEGSSGVIEVSDMDSQVLDQFLQFLYSCKLPEMSMDAATQLYEAADKYSVESLKEVCSAFMKENLTEDNACCILYMADAHSDCELKDCVVAFIVQTKLFKKDDMWLKFCEDHPKLAIEVLNRVCEILSCFV